MGVGGGHITPSSSQRALKGGMEKDEECEMETIKQASWSRSDAKLNPVNSAARSFSNVRYTNTHTHARAHTEPAAVHTCHNRAPKKAAGIIRSLFNHGYVPGRPCESDHSSETRLVCKVRSRD